MYLSKDIVPPTCFKDLAPNNIIGHTEYSYYITNIIKDNTIPYISVTNTSAYFELAVTPKTFMNPSNLQIFFENYRT